MKYLKHFCFFSKTTHRKPSTQNVTKPGFYTIFKQIIWHVAFRRSIPRWRDTGNQWLVREGNHFPPGTRPLHLIYFPVAIKATLNQVSMLCNIYLCVCVYNNNCRSHEFERGGKMELKKEKRSGNQNTVSYMKLSKNVIITLIDNKGILIISLRN